MTATTTDPHRACMIALLAAPVSPCCSKPLEGGPVIFWCTGCRKDVHGSTIDREFRSAAR